MKQPEKRKHQRRSPISVVLPATVELIVGTDEDNPSDDSDWKIPRVESASCEASPRMAEESMSRRGLRGAQ